MNRRDAFCLFGLFPIVGFAWADPTGSNTIPGPVAPTITSATLPTCGTGTMGSMYIAKDATATTFASTYAGGGTNIEPIFCNGTTWIIG